MLLPQSEMFFEVTPGEWQKALIYNPPGDHASCYWSSDDSACRGNYYFWRIDGRERGYPL
jgi:hypothetical protein